MLFDGRAHLPLSAMPGMAERTVKIGSAGKIFSLTGWKVGWAVAAPELAAQVARAHQFLTFTTPPNLQAAVAYGLGKDDAYFTAMRARFQDARDLLAREVSALGYEVLPAEGTYFLNVDLAASGIATDDMTFCTRAVEECGVAAIPLSAFYAEAPVINVVRLCFAKSPGTIANGVAGLAIAKAMMTG